MQNIHAIRDAELKNANGGTVGTGSQASDVIASANGIADALPGLTFDPDAERPFRLEEIRRVNI